MEGSLEPRHLSATEIADLRLEVDSFTELIDYRAKGHKVELVGRETADGAPAYRLRLTKTNGEVADLFLDARTFLEVKRVRRAKTPWGEDQEIVQVLKEYRAVGGLLLPHRIGDFQIEYHVNEPLDDAGFTMPGKKSEEKEADKQNRAPLSPGRPEGERNSDGTKSAEEALAFTKVESSNRRLLAVGAAAPDWTLKDAQGRPHRLSDYRGKVVVMDFWAVWCIPCHRAMPALQKLHDELSGRGVVVLGISTFEKGGDPARLMKDRRYTYGLLLEGESIAEAYGVVGLPTIYVVGVDGRIIHAGGGANEVAEQRRRTFIEEYLKARGM